MRKQKAKTCVCGGCGGGVNSMPQALCNNIFIHCVIFIFR